MPARSPWIAFALAIGVGICPAAAQDEADQDMTIARYVRELGDRTTSKLRLQGYIDGATDGILYLNVIAASKGMPLLCPTENDVFDRQAIRQEVDDLAGPAARDPDVAQLPLAHVVLLVLSRMVPCKEAETSTGAGAGSATTGSRPLTPELKGLIEPPAN
jgi:hypothetical protein